MGKAPQGDPRPATYERWYHYHVHQARHWETQANEEIDKARKRLERANPNASSEWIDKEVSDAHYVKSAIGKQQFHTREATKYGLGMLNETLLGQFALNRASSR